MRSISRRRSPAGGRFGKMRRRTRHSNHRAAGLVRVGMRKSSEYGMPAAAMLAMEAQQVVALRLMRLAVGGTAARPEARLMVAEKVAAAQKAVGLMTTAVLRGAPDGGAD